MVKSRFLEFVHDYILKMFTGSEIIGEEESSTNKSAPFSLLIPREIKSFNEIFFRYI